MYPLKAPYDKSVEPSPDLAPSDAADGGLSDSVALGEIYLSFSGRSDGTDILIVERRTGASALDHVGDVLSLGTGSQVLRVDTGRLITGVQDVQSIRWSDEVFVDPPTDVDLPPVTLAISDDCVSMTESLRPEIALIGELSGEPSKDAFFQRAASTVTDWWIHVLPQGPAAIVRLAQTESAAPAYWSTALLIGAERTAA